MENLKLYFKEVLGIDRILMPLQLNEHRALDIRLIFLSEMGTMNNESNDLLEKMILATKISRSCVQVLELSYQDIAQEIERLEAANVVIAFSSAMADFLKTNFPRVYCLHCPSPNEMLADPSLKKSAWTILQQAMMKISGASV